MCFYMECIITIHNLTEIPIPQGVIENVNTITTFKHKLNKIRFGDRKCGTYTTAYRTGLAGVYEGENRHRKRHNKKEHFTRTLPKPVRKFKITPTLEINFTRNVIKKNKIRKLFEVHTNRNLTHRIKNLEEIWNLLQKTTQYRKY